MNQKPRFGALLILFVLIVVAILFIASHTGSPKTGVENKVATTTDAFSAQSTTLSSSIKQISLPTNSLAANDPEYVKFFEEQVAKDKDFEWKRPISFWGQVVDESNQPINSAQIKFVWSVIATAEFPNGTDQAEAVSDERGVFSLSNKKGKRLSVEVSKEGYYPYLAKGSYEYASPFDGLFVPDSNNPVIFRLKKKGIPETLVTMHGMGDFPGSGRPFDLTNGFPVQISLAHGKRVSSNGDLEIMISVDKPLEGDFSDRFSWSCEIKVLGGGLQENLDQWDFIAPEAGYQAAVVVGFRNTDDGWQNSQTKSYFFRLADGRFGRMNVTISARRPACTIESFINPTGSRNLEYERYKEIRAN